MRIISGTFKSRRIYAPPLHKEEKRNIIRPTSDRARETLFDILTNRIDFKGILSLDLFAGTGAFGFESMSRGANHCSFVDISHKSIALIEKTSADLGLDNNISIYKIDATRFLKSLDNEYDIIFADPPYAFEHYDKLMTLVFAKTFKYFILETGAHLHFDYDIKRFELIERKVGTVHFNIFLSKQ